MTVESRTNTYTGRRQILQYPDDYVASPQFFDEQSSLAQKQPDGRYIIKAGTPFPANDATAIGVVLNDQDVTYGDKNGAILVRGHVNLARCEANFGKAISAAAKTALKGIFFYPLTAAVIAEFTKLTTTSTVAVGSTSVDVIVNLEGTDFKGDTATKNVANWTFAAGTTTLAINKIVKTDEKSVTVTLTSAAAVAGTFTLQAKATAVVNATASNVLSVTVA